MPARHAPTFMPAMIPLPSMLSGPTRPDINDRGAFFDVAVLPETFQACTGFRMHSWCVAGFDSKHPPRERLLADHLIHMTVEHEANAFFPGAELHGPRDSEPAPDPAWCANRRSRASGCRTHRIERRVHLARGIAPFLRRYRSGFDVGLVGKLHHRAGGP